jgi:hypothetical protein
MSWTRARLMGIALLMASFGLVGTGGAQGVVLTGPGFSADVSATVTPTRLPKQGSAPVTLAVAGTIAPAADGSFPQLKAVEVRLDRQLQLTTTGLATCTPSDLLGHALAQARQQCRAALVGGGSVTTQVQYPDTAPFDLRSPVLFFNGATSHLLMYASVPPPVGPAATVASGSARGRVLEVPVSSAAGGAGMPVAFRFRFGKTWTYHGQKQSYLSGSCAGGALSNRVTLTFRDGPRLSGAIPARCGRGD